MDCARLHHHPQVFRLLIWSKRVGPISEITRSMTTKYSYSGTKYTYTGSLQFQTPQNPLLQNKIKKGLP